MKLVRITYDPEYLITQSEFIFTLTTDRPLTVFGAMAFDKDYKLCGLSDAYCTGAY